MKSGDLINIFNSMGQEFSIPTSASTQTVDMSNLPAGSYLLQLWRGEELHRQGRVSKW